MIVNKKHTEGFSRTQPTKGHKLQSLCTSQYKSLPPPRPGTSGALAGDSQHFVSIIGESGH